MSVFNVQLFAQMIKLYLQNNEKKKGINQPEQGGGLFNVDLN